MPEFITNNLSIINFVLINIALGLSIYLTLATGLLSLSNAGFMAIGAYTVAILLTKAQLPLSLGLIVAILLAAAVALPFGMLVLRLRDIYLAIATLGFGEIIRIIALNGDKLVRLFSKDKDITVFQGAEGITLTYTTPPTILGLPETTWSVLLYVIIVAYLLATLQYSRYGRIMAAIRQDETAASTLGINVVRYKLLVFVLGAIIAAGAGALSVPIVRVIDPHNYVFGRAVDILAYAVLGGMTHWAGPIIGATVLTSLPEVLRFLKDQRDIVNGLIIMLSIIYLPSGLADPRIWDFFKKKLSFSKSSRRGT
ncbi:branched-chain amino acid ABC transporter permease [Desulfomonile tiedjei]|uniref:Amino acid/amide ABC transporter membrane protein 2, HAAT family n=1 Tax=Desulfomonile tiedjei (strain ATCC 49306 / DSM 6799 / DCB-1) TaxID=706587 RepID=I4CEY7_DESTA|nr:branched-chain amino acid ABC transporter permease [Desulfomonile tiedjei]AFM28128.1 amino acid/amide ABC transporter membrane protein 2, HAAT family [Desulfomonile tiedjei DSM 6799]